MASRRLPIVRLPFLLLLLLVDQFAHLGDRDHRQEANEQEKQGEKQPERAVERRVIPDRPMIHAPGDGRKSRCRLVTTITYRSSHIPIFTRIAISHRASTLSRTHGTRGTEG